MLVPSETDQPAGPVAFVYAGEWVADCPRSGCANVEFLTHKPKKLRGKAGVRGPIKPCYVCSYCGYHCDSSAMVWPDDAEAILTVLERRPIPHTRNWAPAGHRQAVACGVPEGQSIADLLAENVKNGVA